LYRSQENRHEFVGDEQWDGDLILDTRTREQQREPVDLFRAKFEKRWAGEWRAGEWKATGFAHPAAIQQMAFYSPAPNSLAQYHGPVYGLTGRPAAPEHLESPVFPAATPSRRYESFFPPVGSHRDKNNACGNLYCTEGKQTSAAKTSIPARNRKNGFMVWFLVGGSRGTFEAAAVHKNLAGSRPDSRSGREN
jgi:hypothetical protein